MKKYLILTIIVALLSACASSGDPDAQLTKDWPVEKLYSKAHDELNSGNYTRAVKLYDLLKSRFPYGRFAQQAILDSAYAHYLNEDQEHALAEVKLFELEFPNHPNTDYVLYLKGIILFNEDRSFVNKLASQDWAERDPSANKNAYEAFSELITRYPNSQYVPDATERLTKIVYALGGHEMAVARYYMERGAYLAAANRAKNVITKFQHTDSTEEAIALMMSAYEKMGQTTLSNDSRRVLEANFPNSKYLKTGWVNPKNVPWYSWKGK